MIWKTDLFRIEYLLDFVLGLEKENAVSMENTSIDFLNWLHEQVMKSEFAEPKKIVEALKDARNTIVVYQDEGEYPFGKFTPKDSKERSSFIVDKTLQYFKINLNTTERNKAEKYIYSQLNTDPKTHFLEKYGHIKMSGRGGLAWYYPPYWKEGVKNTWKK